MRVRHGLWLSRAVWLAARLRVADAVGAGPSSTADIARASATHLDSLERLMRALTAEGLFRRDGERGGPSGRLIQCDEGWESGG